MKSDKIQLFFPDILVLKDLLNSTEQQNVLSYFQQHLPEFENLHQAGQDVCRLKQIKLRTNLPPELTLIFEKALGKLESKNVPQNISSYLKFNELYLKYYDKGDSYGMHQDLSSSGLSFVYQAALEKGTYPPLVFADGREIPFEENQLIVFHSHLGHTHSASHSSGKCIVFCMPDLH